MRPEPASDLPYSPAAQRNAGPILALLRAALAPTARVLEIASGTGQHAAACAAAEPGWDWQPTEVDPDALAAIATRCAGLANVRSPVPLDVLAPTWSLPAQRYDAVLCVNLLHIARWPCCTALMTGAARVLRPGGLLIVYGPFRVDGEALAASNHDFDIDLRRRNPAWGLRSLADVTTQAAAAGLACVRRVAMPANNLTVVYTTVDTTAPTAVHTAASVGHRTDTPGRSAEATLISAAPKAT